MKAALFACLLLFPAVLQADTPNCINCQTSGMVNGRYWATLAGPEKIYFLLGMMEGIKAGTTSSLYTVQGVEGFSNFKGLDAFTCPTCTVGDLVSELDLFYQVAPNRGIPVAFALTACIKRFKGATNQELEEHMSRLRKLFSQ